MSAPEGSPPAAPPTSPDTAPPPTTESLPPKRVVRRSGHAGLYTVVGVVVVVGILVGVGYQTHWYGLRPATVSAPGACPAGVELFGDGAQILTPLMSVWEPKYSGLTGNTVNYLGSGSGKGLTHFTSGSLDFAVTDGPLTPSQRTAMPTPALTLPLIGGALTIIYDLPGLSAPLNLNGTVLADIYLGTITNWTDSQIQALNPGVTLPGATIWTVHRGDAAGTTYVLSDFLSQSSASWASTVGKGMTISFPSGPKQSGPTGNSAVITTVTSNPDTIGYTDLTDVLAAAPSPQYAAIQNPAGHDVLPNITNTASAITDKVESMTSIPVSSGDWYNVSMVKANGTYDYPIATFIFMYVFQATDHSYSPTTWSLNDSQVLVQWAKWALSSTAQAMADESQPSQLYYVPLPSQILSVDEAGIGTMTYNGLSIPACS